MSEKENTHKKAMDLAMKVYDTLAEKAGNTYNNAVLDPHVSLDTAYETFIHQVSLAAEASKKTYLSIYNKPNKERCHE